jgi:hypothetical protein
VNRLLGRNKHQQAESLAQAGQPARMKMRYGFNEIYGWWHFSQGEHRNRIQRRLRLMDTKVVRVFVFDQPVPDPFKDWYSFEGMLQAIVDIGAKPMITFAKFAPPYARAKNIKDFVARSSEVVWSCIERWGGEEVSQWYWCIWNEPNNLIVGGDLNFDQYRAIYDALSEEILRQLAPHLGARKAMIGGPAIDGTHRAYWMDWIARLVSEVDERRVGFASWHRYGDWRPAVSSKSLQLQMWGSPDSPNGETFETLLLAQTPGYESSARGVARLLAGRDVLNVCGELNTMSHHEHYYTLGHNQNLLGAAYYVSALIHLIRGGADLELRWTATAHSDAYGLIYLDGKPSHAALAKQLFAQHVKFGDEISFPANRIGEPHLDAIVAEDRRGRISAVFVNTSRRTVMITANDIMPGLDRCENLFRLDSATGDGVAAEKLRGEFALNGYGIGVITNAPSDTIID